MTDLTGWTVIKDDGDSLLVQAPNGERRRIGIGEKRKRYVSANQIFREHGIESEDDCDENRSK